MDFLKKRNILEPDQLPLILMADDDNEDCMLAKDAFDAAETCCLMQFVPDGLELLKFLSGADTLPSLILLDLNMPQKDGRQALIEIKSEPALQHIPIVILTTSELQEDVDLTLKAGAELFITKPATFDEWVEMMKSPAERWLR